MLLGRIFDQNPSKKFKRERKMKSLTKKIIFISTVIASTSLFTSFASAQGLRTLSILSQQEEAVKQEQEQVKTQTTQQKDLLTQQTAVTTEGITQESNLAKKQLTQEQALFNQEMQGKKQIVNQQTQAAQAEIHRDLQKAELQAGLEAQRIENIYGVVGAVTQTAGDVWQARQGNTTAEDAFKRKYNQLQGEDYYTYLQTQYDLAYADYEADPTNEDKINKVNELSQQITSWTEQSADPETKQMLEYKKEKLSDEAAWDRFKEGKFMQQIQQQGSGQ